MFQTMAQTEYESSREREASRKAKKEDSFLNKINTLTRRKKSVTRDERDSTPAAAAVEGRERRAATEPAADDEAERLEREGQQVLESCLVLPEPDLNLLEDGQQVRVLTAESRDDPRLCAVVNELLYWINNELASERIVVRNIYEDFFDGQIIQKLVERLADTRIETSEMSQSEAGQKQKWRVIIDALNRSLFTGGVASPKWSAELIHQKDVVALLQLLVGLALHYRAPIRFPNNVNAQMIVYQRQGRQINKNVITEQITGKQTEIAPQGERDAFDTLFDYGPDKLHHVKSSLVHFCNKHLNKINLEVTDLDTQFQDGVFLILLMGLLEAYFVPLYKFSLQAATTEEKLKNVSFAYYLMEEAGIAKPKARAHDLVCGDLKSTLRILHALFTKYKHL